MTPIVGKVLKFLFEFIFSKVNLKDFVKANRYFLILLASNLLISFLYIYMAEQAIVRTDQYRKLKKENAELVQANKTCRLNEESLMAQLDRASENYLIYKEEVDINQLSEDYSKMSSTIDHIEADLDKLKPAPSVRK